MHKLGNGYHVYRVIDKLYSDPQESFSDQILEDLKKSVEVCYCHPKCKKTVMNFFSSVSFSEVYLKNNDDNNIFFDMSIFLFFFNLTFTYFNSLGITIPIWFSQYPTQKNNVIVKFTRLR